ncbi:lysophospholipid acyltransferase family protein [Marinobacter sp. 1Y8]
MLNGFLKKLFFLVIVKPIVFLVLGLNIYNRERLPLNGPAILAANHNSHLDAMVLMALFPLKRLPDIRPVAAADYFLRNRVLAWFALKVIGIIPLDREGQISRDAVFADCHEALAQGQILVLFPEGSRGSPEEIQPLRKGIYHLARQAGNTAVTPVVMHGLGRSMPKGGSMIVPFNCDVVVGEPCIPGEQVEAFMTGLHEAFEAQLSQCLTRRMESE